jgi:hypothetical protein
MLWIEINGSESEIKKKKSKKKKEKKIELLENNIEKKSIKNDIKNLIESSTQFNPSNMVMRSKTNKKKL